MKLRELKARYHEAQGNVRVTLYSEGDANKVKLSPIYSNAKEINGIASCHEMVIKKGSTVLKKRSEDARPFKTTNRFCEPLVVTRATPLVMNTLSPLPLSPVASVSDFSFFSEVATPLSSQPSTNFILDSMQVLQSGDYLAGEDVAVESQLKDFWRSLSPPVDEAALVGKWFAAVYTLDNGRTQMSVGRATKRFLAEEEGQVTALELDCLKPRVGSGLILEAYPEGQADIYVFLIKDVILGPLLCTLPKKKGSWCFPGHQFLQLG